MSNKITSVEDKIIAARIKLLFNHPFFGNFASRLIIKESSNWLSTAATDGRHIFYNKTFFTDMSIDQIAFTIAHEVLHLIFDHLGRINGRNIQLFNIAADYCVNGQLIRDKIGKAPDMRLYHDVKYYDMSVEQIYDLLLNDDYEHLSSLGGLVDEHIDWDQKDVNNPDRPVYTTNELVQIKNEIISTIIQIAQITSNHSSEITRLINNLTSSKMDWRQILRNEIQSILRNDYTWQRPNRKTIHHGIYLPGSNNDETIDIAIAIDTSGSITNQMLHDFLSEVNGIMEEYQDFKIKIWCFDTDVYNPREYTTDNNESLLTYEISGGGGTDFMTNWKYMEDTDYVPKKFIFFTDGYPNDKWGIEDYCDTVFILHDTNKIVAPFGTTIYYDNM